MPGQEYKPKSAFTGKRLSGVDNRSSSKKNGDAESDLWDSMMPRLDYLPGHIREDRRPATEKLRALPSWLRSLIGR
jgi:hypothetical protein